MTKAELIKAATELKEEVLELRGVSAKVTPELSNLNETAISVVQTSDGAATIVKLKFNLETGIATVSEVIPFPGATHMAVYKANEILNTEIVNKRR